MICLPVTGSRPPYTRTWYVPPRALMPDRSFVGRGAVFVAAMTAAYDAELDTALDKTASQSGSGDLATGV